MTLAYADLPQGNPTKKYVAYCDVTDQPTAPRNFRLLAYGDTKQELRANMKEREVYIQTGPVPTWHEVMVV